MLQDAEILVLKLSLERRLIDSSKISQCVALYKAANKSRSLGDILTKEGGINRQQAAFVGQLAQKARQSRGALMVSRLELEDQLIVKLIQHEKQLESDALKKALMEQKSLAQKGRVMSLGEVLAARHLISNLMLKKMRTRARQRLATCASCYRHYITPQVLPNPEYPCRHCGKTIYVGDLPDKAYTEMSQASAQPAGNPRASGHMRAGPRSSGAIRNPRASGNIRGGQLPPAINAGSGAHASPAVGSGAHALNLNAGSDARHPALKKKAKNPDRIFMTGRFEAIPSLAPKETLPPTAESVQADEEMTMALKDLKGNEKARKAPTGARFGDFEIIEEMARGGMGVIYKAQKGERLVALKVLLAGDEAAESTLKRFKKEAEISRKLKHPGIVAFIGAGEIQDFPYLALEFIEGDTVEEMLANGPMDPKIAAKILRDVAEAVHHAHKRSIVHRDLKPANIIIDEDSSKPKVIDFGVAKALDAMTMTQSGVAIGTPYYMSPEQVKGQNELIGPRTDVYSLGVILYEMLTGTVPFQGDNPMELYHNIASEEIQLPTSRQSRIPVELETICLVAMGKEPEQRYPDALEMAKDLARFLGGRPIEARRPGSGIMALLTNPIVLIVGAVIFAVALIVIVSSL